MKFRNVSFRSQLNLWFVGSIISVWSVLAVISGIVVWRILLNQVDHHLHTVMLETRRIWTEEDQQTRNAAISNFVSSQGMVVMVLASDGSSLLQTTSPDVTALTQQELQTILTTQQQSDSPLDYHFYYQNIRFATTPLVEHASSGIVAVGYSLELFYQTLRQLIGVMLGVTVFLVFILIWIGQVVTRKALSPITSIIQTAQTINESGSLTARIPHRDVKDELGMLTTTLNTMLEKLQITFDKEREFFADAAHSLKTPLSVLRVQLENLRNQPSLPKAKLKAEEAIRHLDTSAELVQDLLLLARIDSKSVNKQVKISHLLTELVDLISHLSEVKQLEVKLEIKEQMVVKGDRSLLSKAIISLLENAIAYTPEGGTIKVALTPMESRYSTKLVIADTGPGIPKKEQGRIWDRFWRGKSGMSSGTGSGLGLAIAKAVVEHHGGTIRYHSTKKWPSIFIIYLP